MGSKLSIRQFAHSLVFCSSWGGGSKHRHDDHCSSISHISELETGRQAKRRGKKKTILLSGKDDQMLRWKPSTVQVDMKRKGKKPSCSPLLLLLKKTVVKSQLGSTVSFSRLKNAIFFIPSLLFTVQQMENKKVYQSNGFLTWNDLANGARRCIPSLSPSFPEMCER